MSDTELLEEYKKMPNPVKDKLGYLVAINECYDCNSDFSDEMVISILGLANECWRQDEYSQASMADYANYISNGVIDNKMSIDQLNNLYDADVVEAYNNESDFNILLKYDVSEYEFAFRTNDGNRYYIKDDGFVIIDKEDMLVRESSPMEDPMDEIFDLLANNKIEYIPLSMHYNIRCMIKNDIIPDTELKEQYGKGIENYQNYCENRYITSNDILKAVNLDTNIKLFDIDNLFTEQNKLARLEKYNGKKYNDYSYVASLSNGTDYYYNDGLYLALDKNGITKFFDDEPFFLLKELKNRDKFTFISLDEAKKISNELTKDYLSDSKRFNENSFIRKDKGLYATRQFLKYENDKELNSFSDKSIPNYLTLRISFAEMQREHFKEQIRSTKMAKEENLKKQTEKALDV